MQRDNEKTKKPCLSRDAHQMHQIKCHNMHTVIVTAYLFFFTYLTHVFPHSITICTILFIESYQQSMATIIKLSSFVFLLVLLGNSQVLSSTTEPTIPASPGVLPYVTAPDISSFFPTPSDNQPMSSAAPSEAEPPAPAPSSGEFDGKKTSGSARLDCAIFGIMLCSFLISSIVIA